MSEQTQCPTCDRDDFSSRKGMKVHHKYAHGESISGYSKTCPNCNENFRAPKESREYCSQSCAAEDNSVGEQNPAWKGGCFPEIDCQWCGDSFEVHRSKADEKKFCSRECFGNHRSTLTGKDNPTYKAIIVECATCGSEFDKEPNQYNATDRHFCDHSCYGKWMAENWVGESHPRYNGGHNPNYGDNWREQREKCFKRDDYACRGCGISREQHIETFNADLHSHHVIPKRKFESLEAANDLGNLVTLCRECHPKWEGIPVAPH